MVNIYMNFHRKGRIRRLILIKNFNRLKLWKKVSKWCGFVNKQIFDIGQVSNKYRKREIRAIASWRHLVYFEFGANMDGDEG